MVIAWSPYTVCIGSKRGANADIHYFREYALSEVTNRCGQLVDRSD